jgi:hypothetical protein
MFDTEKQSLINICKIPEKTLKTLLTKLWPYAILIFAYDEGRNIVKKHWW